MPAMHAVLLRIRNVLNVDELAILPVGADRLQEQGMVVSSGNGGEAAAESAVAIVTAKEGKGQHRKKKQGGGRVHQLEELDEEGDSDESSSKEGIML
jgi:hypothetical protein